MRAIIVFQVQGIEGYLTLQARSCRIHSLHQIKSRPTSSTAPAQIWGGRMGCGELDKTFRTLVFPIDIWTLQFLLKSLSSENRVAGLLFWGLKMIKRPQHYQPRGMFVSYEWREERSPPEKGKSISRPLRGGGIPLIAPLFTWIYFIQHTHTLYVLYSL